MSKFHISHEPVEVDGQLFCPKCGGLGSSILLSRNCESLSQETSELSSQFKKSHIHVGFDGHSARCLECHGRNGELKRYSCQQIAAAALPAEAEPNIRSKLLMERYPTGRALEIANERMQEKIVMGTMKYVTITIVAVCVVGAIYIEFTSDRSSRPPRTEPRPMSAMEKEYQRDEELIKKIQTKQYYRALRKEGFTEEEAERLAPAFQKTFGD